MKASLVRSGAAVFALLAAMLAGCGGGGGGDGGSGTAVPSLGFLLDAPVQGVSYVTAPSKHNGVTGADGSYTYEAGDTVSFKVGNLTLATVPASGVVTPQDLGAAISQGAVSGADQIALNTARFLQTFVDSSGKIVIPAALATATDIPALSFDQSSADFTTAYNNFVMALNSSHSLALKPVGEDSARYHMRQQGTALLAQTWVVMKNGAFQDIAVTFFPDGTYLLGGIWNTTACPAVGVDAEQFPSDPNSNGIERGRYQWDMESGKFRVTEMYYETDGTCGLRGPADEQTTRQPRLKLVDRQKLEFSINKGEAACHRAATTAGSRCVFTLNPAAGGNNTLRGAWLITNNDLGVAMINGESAGSFLYMNLYGIEKGSYSIAPDRTVTVNTSGPGGVDTNGSGSGFSIAQTMAIRMFVDSASGELVFTDSECPSCLSGGRLPEALATAPSVPGAADLFGAWVLQRADADASAPVREVVAFYDDGTYVMGTQSDDAGCKSRYQGTDRASSYLDPDGNGSELAFWSINSGLLNITGPAAADTNGDCGFYVFGAGGSPFLKKIDADTLQIQYGGRPEYQGASLRRVKNNPNSLVGAWTRINSFGQYPTRRDLLVLLKDGTAFSVSSGKAGGDGGIERGKYSLNNAGDVLTLSIGNQVSTLCVDTAGQINSCTSGWSKALQFSFDDWKEGFYLQDRGHYTRLGRTPYDGSTNPPGQGGGSVGGGSTTGGGGYGGIYGEPEAGGGGVLGGLGF